MNNKLFITVLAALLGSNALCAAEHVLVASSGSHSLEEFDTSGNWTRTFATTGPYAPVAMAQSPKTGEIFVTTEVPSGDYNRVLRYHPDGTFDANWDTFTVTCQGCGGGGTESLLFDSDGNLYLATHYGEDFGDPIYIFKYLAQDLQQANPTQLPASIHTQMVRGDQMAFKSADEICIAGFIDEDVKCFNTSSGAQTADYYAEIHAAKVSPGIEPGGLAFDSSGRLYLTSIFGGQVARETAPGGPIVQLAQVTANPGELDGNLVIRGDQIFTTTYSTQPATLSTPDSAVSISMSTGAITKFISGSAAPQLGKAHIWGAYWLIFYADSGFTQCPLECPIQ